MNKTDNFFLAKEGAQIKRYSRDNQPPHGFRAFKAGPDSAALQIRAGTSYAHVEVTLGELDAIIRALALLRCSIESPSKTKFGAFEQGRPN